MEKRITSIFNFWQISGILLVVPSTFTPIIFLPIFSLSSSTIAMGLYSPEGCLKTSFKNIAVESPPPMINILFWGLPEFEETLSKSLFTL